MEAVCVLLREYPGYPTPSPPTPYFPSIYRLIATTQTRPSPMHLQLLQSSLHPTMASIASVPYLAAVGSAPAAYRR